MEMLLFESKTVYPFQMGLKGRTYFCPFSCRKHKVDLKFPQCCSCIGTAPRASYLSISKIAQASHETTGSMSKQKVSSEVFHYSINGANGASNLKLFPGQKTILNGFDDEYGGIVVDPDQLPSDPDAFSSILRVSLSHWKMKGKKGIWLKLPLEQSRLIPIAIEEGFVYHHAEPRYLMLTYWIPNGPCMLPSNATHQVGIGGFVINDKNEVLVVQEKHCPPTCIDLWKIPTGFILEAEEISSGAVREVKEETGIDTEFVEVVAFRHAHNVAFEKSDLLFVCMLKPLSNEILVDDLEIQAAKWMSLDEFVAQPLLREDSLFDKIIEICVAQIRNRYCGLSALQLPSKFDGKQSSLYYNLIDSRSSFHSVQEIKADSDRFS